MKNISIKETHNSVLLSLETIEVALAVVTNSIIKITNVAIHAKEATTIRIVEKTGEAVTIDIPIINIIVGIIVNNIFAIVSFFNEIM
ncbi:hypothetical protein ACNQ2B_00960 [Mycoplasma sp. Z707]|uniref:hypothetical protein n=1 Tax=Mycoplasma sp. Z707 TaxID=3401691 RepID=UPI003AABB73D